MLQRIDSEMNNSTGITRGRTEAPRTEETEAWYGRRQGCVALALDGDVAEMARLASQCLELLASQSVTAVNVILA